MIDQQQLADLRAKAEAATPGPWSIHTRFNGTWCVAEDVLVRNGGYIYGRDRIFDDGSACGEYGEVCSPRNRDYIVAANPATVLGLLDEIDRHRDDDNLAVMNDDFCKLLRSLGISDHARPASCHRIVHDEILPEIERLRNERDSLLRIINDSFLSLYNPSSTMAFDGRNLTQHVEEASRAAVILHGKIGEAGMEIERLRERNAKLERVREAAERASEVWSAPVWVEFRAALDAAKEDTDD